MLERAARRGRRAGVHHARITDLPAREANPGQYQIERAVCKAAGGRKQFEDHRDGELSKIRGDGGPETTMGTGGM